MLPACSDAASVIQTRVDPVFAIKSWQTSDGLPINNVTAIAQTPEGYIWLGTGNGVVRFDGVRFKSFGLRDGLGSVSISKLLVDHTGALWVGTFGGGLSRWTGQRFETWSSQDGLTGENISALAEDAEGTLWIGTWTGLSGLTQGKFSAADGLTNAQVRALARDYAGAIWVATSPGGLYRLREKKFVPVTGPTGVDLGGSRSLLGDRKGNLWIGMGNKALLLCLGAEGWATYGPEHGLPNAVSALAEGADGNLWVGTPNAGLVYLYQGHFVTINQEHGLSSQAVRAVLEDREGSVWVATLSDGLNRLRRARVTAYGPKQGLVTTVNSVGELGDGLLCVGTSEHGLWRQEGLRLEKFFIGDQFLSNAPAVYSVLATQNGDLWCGTQRGLYWWREGQSAVAIGLEQFKSVEAVRSLCDDGQGGVFAGTALGRVFQARAGTLNLVTDQLSSRYVTALLRDAEGALWIGSGGGLYRMRNGYLTSFTTTNGLLSDAIRTLYLAPDASLWIGTAGGGLSYFRNNRFASFTTEHGLPDNIISQILKDDSGDFWFGSSRGIFRVRQQELAELVEGKIPFVHPLLLDQADGMPADLCTGGYSPGAIKRKSGELCFPTIKGLVVVDPNRFKEQAVPPRVILEEVLVDDEHQPRRYVTARSSNQANVNPGMDSSNSTTNQAPVTSAPMVIPPGRHRIEFHYTGLSASVPETINFKYRLQGLEDWVEVGAERVARYRNTPPGHYHFQVLACNLDGIWTDTGPTLAVVVQPYFWQTWWFKGALVLALTACVFGIYEWRLSCAHRAREAQQILSRSLIESQETERKRIATDLHDSLGQDLMLINNRLSLLVTKAADPEDLASQVSEISKTTLRAIADMRAIAEALRPPDLEHIGITKAIEWLIDKVALVSRARISTELDNIDGLLSADQEIHLYRIIQEGLNNVVKHAAASEAILGIKREPTSIRVSLFDDGIGFDAETRLRETESRPGIGFSSMRERARVLGGELIIQSSPGHGARLTVIVPVLSAPLSRDRAPLGGG